jgi:hypothetical protein
MQTSVMARNEFAAGSARKSMMTKANLKKAARGFESKTLILRRVSDLCRHLFLLPDIHPSCRRALGLHQTNHQLLSPASLALTRLWLGRSGRLLLH